MDATKQFIHEVPDINEIYISTYWFDKRKKRKALFFKELVLCPREIKWLYFNKIL